MELIYADYGSGPNRTGVTDGAGGVTWYAVLPAAQYLIQNGLTSSDILCRPAYDSFYMANSAGALVKFDGAAWSSFGAITSGSDGIVHKANGRYYVRVSTDIFSTTDFSTWVNTANPAGNTFASGTDGLYMLTGTGGTGSGAGRETVQIYKTTTGTSSALNRSYTNVDGGDGHLLQTDNIAVTTATSKVYGRQYNYIGRYIEPATEIYYSHATPQFTSALNGTGGAYMVRSDGSDYYLHFALDIVSFSVVFTSVGREILLFPTETGVVAVYYADGDSLVHARTYVNGAATTNDTFPPQWAYTILGVRLGASAPPPLVPFWNNYVNSIESA